MFPGGDKYSTNSLYLFLHLRDLKDLDPDSRMIELALSILD
jgi:hypothetical protein